MNNTWVDSVGRSVESNISKVEAQTIKKAQDVMKKWDAICEHYDCSENGLFNKEVSLKTINEEVRRKYGGNEINGVRI